MNWTRWYSKNNATPLISHGLITPETDMSTAVKGEQLRAHMLKYNYVFVFVDHPVMDLVKRLKIPMITENLELSNVDQTGWYKVASVLFEFCMRETKKQLAIIRIQRFFRWASWRHQMPSLKNVKAFHQTAMAASLPDDIVGTIVVLYFIEKRGSGFTRGTAVYESLITVRNERN